MVGGKFPEKEAQDVAITYDALGAGGGCSIGHL